MIEPSGSGKSARLKCLQPSGDTYRPTKGTALVNDHDFASQVKSLSQHSGYAPPHDDIVHPKLPAVAFEREWGTLLGSPTILGIMSATYILLCTSKPIIWFWGKNRDAWLLELRSSL